MMVPTSDAYSEKLQNSEKTAEVKDKAVAGGRRFAFIKNAYTKARGEPMLLEITCRACRAWVMDYQKDGPGPLLRCYTDRIHKPARLRKESFSVRNVGIAPALCCSGCNTELGKPFIYRRKEDIERNKVTEKRPAYLILTDATPGSETEVPRIEYHEKSV